MPIGFAPLRDPKGANSWMIKSDGFIITRIEPMDKDGNFPKMEYNPKGVDKDVVDFLVQYGFKEEEALEKWGTINGSQLVGIQEYIP